MKIENILKHLQEAPLPDDWDKSIYSDRVSFKKRIEYAKQHAKRIGGGSARVAFEIPYQGRQTVLKVAKNRKGMAQNEEEAGMLRTAEVLGASGSVVVPMIDYDETQSQPTWLHVEYARKLKSTNEFKRLTGFELEDLLAYAAKISSLNFPGRQKEFSKEFEEAVWKEDSFAYDLVSFIGNTEMHLGDLTRPANWGVYKNRPVIIDMGASEDIIRKFYS